MDEPVGGPGTAASQAGSLVEPRTHVEKILASLFPPATPLNLGRGSTPSSTKGAAGGPVGGGATAARGPSAARGMAASGVPGPAPTASSERWRRSPSGCGRGGRGRSFGSRARPAPLPAHRSPLRCPSVTAPRLPEHLSNAILPRSQGPPPQPEHWPRSLPGPLLLPALLVLLERVPRPSHCSRAPPPPRPLGRSPASPAHRLARVP